MLIETRATLFKYKKLPNYVEIDNLINPIKFGVSRIISALLHVICRDESSNESMKVI